MPDLDTAEALFEQAADKLKLRQAAFARSGPRLDLLAHVPRVAAAPKVVRLPDIDRMPTAEEESPICPACHDRGWRREGLDARVCACRIKTYGGPESIPAADLQAFGVPADVAGAARSTWDESISKWRPEFDAWPGRIRNRATGERPKMLLFYGPVGNGKSRAAAWIFRRAFARGRRCWWIDVPAAVDMVLQAIGDRHSERTAQTKISAWLSRDLVVLDDVGFNRETEFQDNLVANWIRARYSSGSYTVATTNLAPVALRRRLPASASRLSSGPVLEIKGKDGRRKDWSLTLARSIKGAK